MMIGNYPYAWAVMIAFGASACRAEPVALDGAAFEIKRFDVGAGDATSTMTVFWIWR